MKNWNFINRFQYHDQANVVEAQLWKHATDPLLPGHHCTPTLVQTFPLTAVHPGDSRLPPDVNADPQMSAEEEWNRIAQHILDQIPLEERKYYYVGSCHCNEVDNHTNH